MKVVLNVQLQICSGENYDKLVLFQVCVCVHDDVP